jgi:hypothetical protein
MPCHGHATIVRSFPWLSLWSLCPPLSLGRCDLASSCSPQTFLQHHHLHQIWVSPTSGRCPVIPSSPGGGARGGRVNHGHGPRQTSTDRGPPRRRRPLLLISAGLSSSRFLDRRAVPSRPGIVQSVRCCRRVLQLFGDRFGFWSCIAPSGASMRFGRSYRGGPPPARRRTTRVCVA